MTGVQTCALPICLRGDVSDRKEVEKAVAALQRRGFAWNDIKRALETYGSSLPEEE